MPTIRIVVAASFLLSLLAAPAQAARFSDVPEDHVFAAHIAALAEREVVRGHPDGTFRPSSVVNRAELLTLLYRTQDRLPQEEGAACFSDVERGSWYEAVVCDGAAQGFVSGYPDRTFRPQQGVNRVEALKMIHTVFGFDHPAAVPPAVGERYDDIDASAWYAPYLGAAWLRQVIPVAGQEGPSFDPGALLTRGEAAAYIAQALQGHRASSSSSAAVADPRSRSSAAQGGDVPDGTDVSFPFRDSGVFRAFAPRVIRFSVRQPLVADVRVTVDPGSGTPGLSCRLFHIRSDGFSIEYYLGHVVGNTCAIRAAVGEGDYQLEVRPRQAGASFTVDGTTVAGDGNDGFREARSIGIRQSRTGTLEEEDIADWFTFTLNIPQRLKVSVSNDDVRCIVYAMQDVDLFGFTGPECNAPYDYPRGTYVIGVQRKDGRQDVLPYAVHVK